MPTRKKCKKCNAKRGENKYSEEEWKKGKNRICNKCLGTPDPQKQEIKNPDRKDTEWMKMTYNYQKKQSKIKLAELAAEEKKESSERKSRGRPRNTIRKLGINNRLPYGRILTVHIIDTVEATDNAMKNLKDTSFVV